MAGETVLWASVADVGAFLGLAPTDTADTAYLAAVTAAANAWAYRRRRTAGYTADVPEVSPGPDATLGVVMVAGGWYRRRGAPDGFAGWSDLGAGEVWSPGGIADIYRLLGIGRPLAV